MKQIPASQVFAPRREPCAECGMPVFIAERLRIPHMPRAHHGGEEDSGGGKSNPPTQQSFLLMHRTCFRCARCHQQLSPAGGYYETESGAFCCEVCPDEERPSPVHKAVKNIRGHPEGTLAVQTDDEESEGEDEGDAATGSNMDSYSEDFESALEASGRGSDNSPVHVTIPNGASSSLDGSQIPYNVQASDGAINFNAKSSSSNSSFLSIKSHSESSPIVQRITKVAGEDGAEADGEGKPSEPKVELKEPESQYSKSDASQFVQKLHPTDVIEKRIDGRSGDVMIRKGETGDSGGEVNSQSTRPFSVVDRVRMFEREVKVRQSLPKDTRSAVVKEKDQIGRESEGNSAKREAVINVIGTSLTVESGSSPGGFNSEAICKAESNGVPEEERNEIKKSIEDIPFMDENGDISRNEEMMDLPVKDVTDLKGKEPLKDIPFEEEMEVTSKEEVSEFPHEEETPLCKEEVANFPPEETTTGSCGDTISSLLKLESLDAANSEDSEQVKSVVSSLEDKTECVGEVDHRKEVEESIKAEEQLEEHVEEKEMIENGKGEGGIQELESKEASRSKSEERVHGETIKVVVESPEGEEEITSELVEKKVKVLPLPSDKIFYPEGLNPFGEDDEEDKPKVAEVVKKKIIPVSLNPFGSSDEEEEEEEVTVRRKLPVPAIRRSFNALDSFGRNDRPSSEDRKNPFWSAGEDDDSECPRERTRRKSQSNVSDPDRPIPKPRTVWSSVTSSPEPSPKPRRVASPCQSAESTLTRRRKKKPAPPPPMPQTPQPLPRASTPTPQPSGDVSLTSSPSPSISTTTSPGGTPRRPRKSRPAPPRPVSPTQLDSPSSVRDNVPLLPLNSSLDDNSPETGESTSLKDETEFKTPPSSSPSTRPPPESEKRQKDAENRNRRSRTSGGEEEETTEKEDVAQVVSDRAPDKSTYGPWKRKKGPAPPRPLPQKRKLNPHVPLSEIRRELCDIEVQQMELERQGVALERAIRSRFQQEDSPNDAWIPAEVEAQVLQLFELVNEKNELFRRQAELMYMRRQQRLEEEHADLEFQIRCLMERPSSLKTDADKEREEMLIQRLVEVVQARDEVVQCLESDRLREAQEDVTVRARLAGAFPGKAAEKGEVEEEVEEEAALGEKGKKSKKDKKVWERMKKKVVGKKGSGGVLHLGKGKRKKDADKDVDEVEEEGKRKEGGAW